MKRFLITLIVLLFICNFKTFPGDRMVILERFTSWTCPPCATNNPILDAWLAVQDPERIVGLSYHMNWPAPGNDGFYIYNPTDNTARRTFYGVNSIPQARMDGLIDLQPPYSSGQLTGVFNTRTNILTPVTIVVTDSTFGDSILVRVRIYGEVLMANPNVTVQIVMLEKLISYTNPPGTNGETQFHDVMRRMKPSGNGTQITCLPGQTYIIEQKFYRDPIWQTSQTRAVVFVQGAGLQVFAAGIKTINFNLIPTSPYRSVVQGQSQSANYDIAIPTVASGYNSPVTLTATIDPPTAGVTVSFPTGNVISTFPGTKQITVSSTGSVPTGAYRIIITGTNTNNKTHSTSVSYLVGQNYVSVGMNRTNVQFRVDNVTYTSNQFYTWDLNSQHIVAAVSPQTFGPRRYYYRSWSDGGAITHTVTVTQNTLPIICDYGAQFKLLGSAFPSGIPVTINGVNVFYDSASAFTLSCTPTQLVWNNQEWYFERWNGTGNGSYSGTTLNPQITMHDVIAEDVEFDTIAPIGIKPIQSGVPQVYSLHQNFPNPFNPSTKIRFDLPRQGDVLIKVFDILGRETKELYSGFLREGYYEIELDASNLSSGVYFYQINAGDFTNVKRMILMK